MVRGTKTSRFGVSKRECHDSTPFYRGKLYQDLKVAEGEPEIENPIPPEVLDRVLCSDSRKMNSIPDSSVHLMVTSPPYNVGKEYDEDLNLEEYSGLLKGVFSETNRVLVNGGRACINIANVGRKPYIPYHKFVIDVMTEVGFLMRGEVIWNKGAGAGASTAWGSWLSPTNPTLRDTHEYILVFSKGKFGRSDKGREPTISKEEFLEYTKSVWEFQPESAEKVGHPAPFPVELPYRCIQLYTFKGEVVLDPFCGAGATCLAARNTGRHYIGIDINQEYVERAMQRIELLVQRDRLRQLLPSQRKPSEGAPRKERSHKKRQNGPSQGVLT
ncbi:MAG: site-specific DNA-methyltransferase [Promethearchaeati archaeon SRVP18_Atabeyarchaeia-1]